MTHRTTSTTYSATVQAGGRDTIGPRYPMDIVDRDGRFVCPAWRYSAAVEWLGTWNGVIQLLAPNGAVMHEQTVAGSPGSVVWRGYADVQSVRLRAVPSTGGPFEVAVQYTLIAQHGG